MAYLKPQAPLKDKDGDFLYPLTTIDQVIVEDGSRLNNVVSDILNTINILTTTTDDNGKILRVVDGVPAWVAIPNAEEASF